ncbi:Alkaline phosphatase D [bacterium HR36]|uniref:Phosphodiesterase/alkaline phosphatase D n=1 Tax=uncultured Planctomycetota bacterium TaxID=120965 RepID=H5SCP5_9BACT|nr:phosphodiesterase/alkaline phosphatase D [uncultured Planctomycetota bacterium]GBD35182.1 Alkaline phosphatase D [bacterium HR36]
MKRILALALTVLLELLASGFAAPALDRTKVVARIAFGSCAHQDKPQPIWDAIIAQRPDLFLFIGDNIYADTEDMEVMKAKYAKLAAQPGFRKLRQLCPILATWDDHDYGKNDAGYEYAKKRESQQIFLDFFGEPADSPRRQREGVYDAVVLGPEGKRVQILLLDTRYFRSPLKRRPDKPKRGEGPYVPNPDPNATLLGAAQWRWLEEQLQQPAELRIIASSIQVIAEDHHWEKWANFPQEQERLFRLIRDTQAAGVIFISGDRHLAELSVRDAGVGYPLYDLTSSGLTEADKTWGRWEINRYRVGTMFWGNNFGLITIDWDRQDPLIRLQIRDEQGEIFLQQKIPLSLLKPGAIKTPGK